MADVTDSKSSSSDSASKAWAGLQAQYSDFKGREALLTPEEWKNYLDVAHQINAGPSNFDELHTQSLDKFKTDLSAALKGQFGLTPAKISEVVDKAAQRFVLERKTGEQGLGEFVAQAAGITPSQELNQAVNGVSQNLNTQAGGYIAQGPGDFSSELSRISQGLVQAQEKVGNQQRQATIDATTQGQQQEAQGLMNTALQQLAKPADLFQNPQLAQEALAQIQNIGSKQGETARQNVEAGAAARGITGSSTEQFGWAQTQAQSTDAITNQVLNFLLQSGQQGEQAKQFLVSSLQNQAGALLGAGQQTQSLGASTNIAQQGVNLQSQALQNQINQFNQSLQSQQQEFGQALDFQKSQAAENMQLLLRQLNSGGGNYGALGGLLGAGTGLGLGALLAAPTGGLSLAAGAGIGAGAGYLGGMGLGSLFGR